MPSKGSQLGHGLAKVLGIKLDYRQEMEAEKITRGESVFSVSSADTFVEAEPTVYEWFSEITPSRSDMMNYTRNLFPFTRWIGRYNLQWLAGDLVAGITIGAVVVPQGMAYAKLAELPVEYGLYSSFMGVLIYWFFATSKDITIGPVAVMSTIVGNVVLKAQKSNPELDAHVIASALAIICGAIVCFLGLARLGWIVDFISLTSISAFMTGSAINICVGQIPTMMGITGFSTRDSTYLVVIHILQHLGRSKLDAAMGLTALVFLYVLRFGFQYLGNKFPKHRKLLFFMSTLRTVFIILLYTMISWLVNRNIPRIHKKNNLSKFKLLGTVPRGFKHAAVPTITTDIIKVFASEIPASVIVLLIEHISIAKSFGRVNNYAIDPSQELVAIGVSNLLGPFLGGYPVTGSFSRTAIKSKAGVRTPFAGVITAIIVLLAIYALPAVFFYIPNSVLSAVIIHAVGDLITPPNTVYQFWKISPIEVLIFFAGVLVTVFSSIENGIYTTICVSIALLLFRVVKARGRFLGKVQVHSVIGDHLLEDKDKPSNGYGHEKADRSIFLPLEHNDGSNPMIDAKSPYPGIFIYRFSEGYNYPNANHYLDYMVQSIFQQTRRTNPNAYGRPGDRPWNDPGPRRGKTVNVDYDKPTLKAVILDFSSVNNVDVTSVQHLIDVRNQLDRYSSPEKVQWHFAHINNRWTRRALASAGFGYPTEDAEEFKRWKPIFSVAELGGTSSAAADAEYAMNHAEHKKHRDLEIGRSQSREITGESSETSSDINQTIHNSKAYGAQTSQKKIVVHGLNRPFFHIDLTSALQSAIANMHDPSATADVVQDDDKLH
ncbi:sulfate permease [Aureobasidium pullulans]|uniref:Sulfate permease n=1 Tax=Aureobasidium pullulans TaxID=5580 RepID=A0A4S9M1J6_AURPU|nr:sulfate permease [Aureobasidium pullulans]